jgi:uncharacterized protein (TIGR02145 family)
MSSGLIHQQAAMVSAGSSNSVPSGVQGVCPVGWYLPSNGEWTLLADHLGVQMKLEGK